MITISLCMIVKNEESNLGACLETVCDIVDEINIIDTGSTDKTVEIAKKYTDRIFFFEWVNDFSKARNFSFEKATKEYILWLDADDVIYEKDREKFKALKNSLNKNIDIVFMDYRCKKDEFGNILINQKRERLIKRSLGLKWRGKIHETLPITGKTLVSDIGIDHEHHNKPAASQKRNIEILESIIDTPEETINDLYYYVKTLYNEKEYDKVLPYLERFSKQNKKEKMPAMDAYLALHYTYLIKNDFEKAYLCLAENDSLLNNYSEYYCALGNFSAKLLKDSNLAIDYYKKALNCKGDESDVGGYTYAKYYYFTPYLALGENYAKLGKTSEALECYNKALSYTVNENEIEDIKNRIKAL